MTMADTAQACIMLTGAIIVLWACASPVVESVAQPLIASLSHDDLFGFTALSADRCNAGIGSERVIIALCQRISPFGDHRRGDHAPDSWD